MSGIQLGTPLDHCQNCKLAQNLACEESMLVGQACISQRHSAHVQTINLTRAKVSERIAAWSL